MDFSFERRKRIPITSAFHKHLDESSHKSLKIWVDNGSKFYKGSI